MYLFFGVVGVVLVVLSLIAGVITRNEPPPMPPTQVTLGEVTDLINRLKPLAERPDDDWRGVSLKFTGASVTVEIHTKDGNKYTGKGPTLDAAVKMIDSTKIRDALQGWKQ